RTLPGTEDSAQADQQVTTLHLLHRVDHQPGHRPRGGRGDRRLYLHRLDGGHRLTDLHLITLGDRQRDRTREGRRHVLGVVPVRLLGGTHGRGERTVTDLERTQLVVERGHHRTGTTLSGLAHGP